MTLNSAAIYALFETAISHKLKYPKIRLRASNGVNVVLRRNGAKSRYPGTIAVTDDRSFGNNSYFGRIETDGRFIDGRDACTPVVELLSRLAIDPAGTAAEYGRLSGNCAFCDSKLTDARSTAVGYGPICAKHFGQPWGTDFKSQLEVA